MQAITNVPARAKNFFCATTDKLSVCGTAHRTIETALNCKCKKECVKMMYFGSFTVVAK
jgi:hypothetical protein